MPIIERLVTSFVSALCVSVTATWGALLVRGAI